MIKTLRRKFIAIAMLSVVIVLTILIGAMDILNYYEVRQNIQSEMSLLQSFDGDLSEFHQEFGQGQEQNPPVMVRPGRKNAAPPALREDEDDDATIDTDFSEDREEPDRDWSSLPEEFNEDLRRGRISRETPFSIRYFTVTFDSKGQAADANVRQIAAVSETDAKGIATELYGEKKVQGFYDDYYYSAIEVTDDDGSIQTRYIFLDCSEELSSFRRFRNISFVVSLFGIALVFVLVVFLSKIVMRPVAESYEKQKHFITDASHEIKTPLAIIEANTEVLEMTEGENEWLQSIRHQISRLSGLTEKLVFLSRMDEEGTKLEMMEFSLSDALSDVAESFLPVAKTRNRKLKIDIEDGIMYQGDKDKISQMLSLLLDNAMKYSNEGGTVKASLRPASKGRKEIKVYNTVEEIVPGKHDELFERFYRADASRSSETGGSGIGLSVVKAIAGAHKGKVSCESKDGTSIEFKVILG